MRQGNFTELESAAQNLAGNGGNYKTNYPLCVTSGLAGKTSPGLIYDPTTCQPFSNNTIPAGRMNPAAVAYLSAFPTPTRTDRYLNNYLDTQSEKNKYNTFDVRFDWNPTSKDMAFARFSYDNSVNSKTSEFANLPAGGGPATTPRTRAATLSATRTSSRRTS